STLTPNSLVVTDANRNLSSSNININNVVQNISTGTAGNIFNITTSTNSLVINVPFANITTTGQLQSSDFLSFNNKLSGSLTSGYLPKATGASTTANSVLFETNSKIGLNTSTPAASLVVVTSGATTSPLTIASSSGSSFLTINYLGS